MSDAKEFHEEDLVGKVYDRRLLGRLLGYVKPHLGPAVLAVVLILFSAFLQLIGPLATAIALDLYIQPLEDEKLSSISLGFRQLLTSAGLELTPLEGVGLMSLIYLAALLLTFAVLYAQGFVMQLMGQFIMYDIRRDIFGHLQRLPIAYFDRQPVGRLVTRATTDVASLNEIFSSGFVAILGDLLLLVGIIAVLFAMNWQLALISFSIVPLLLVLTRWFRNRARDSYRDVRVKIARINSFLQEHITGMSIVQLFNREKQAFEDFSEINHQHRTANVRAIFFYAVYFPGVALVTSIGLALIIWYGGGQILRGLLSLGALVAFLQYAQRFYQPISALSERYNVLQAAMASAERIFQLIDTPAAISVPANSYSPTQVRGAIEFDRVCFSYKENEPVIKDLSFRVAPGETIAIVGHTGAGKSTITNLLLRFYDVQDGAIRVDGVDLKSWNLETLRGHIAMVLQDVFLFSGDVASNIRLGKESIDDARLRQAAAEVGALGFIERLPEGFATEVRERGAGLSVGQRQLIAFARALAFDPRILILDEATASIDTETEQHIQKALERLLVGRTSLVIAHRLSTIQRADRILVLHKGELREFGTHQELLAAQGIYQKLYLLQYNGMDQPLTPSKEELKQEVSE